jgi:uncharacterized oxidoreductase
MADDKSPALLTFGADDMRRFIAGMFTAAGWPQSDSDVTAEHLVVADLSGHPSHGIGMLPMYMEAVRAGMLKPSNQPQVLRAEGPFVLIDARLALGQPAAMDATHRAVAVARDHGVAVVNLVNAHHIGRVGHYGEVVAEAGLVGLFWVNVHGRSPVVAPYGGREARFTTNPHCVAIPRPGAQPFLLDFATSEIAMGKARVAYARGKKVKEGALIDHRGRPTTDPAVMFEEPLGALATFGLHKGFGMALVCELLSSVLGGANTSAEPITRAAVHNNMLAIVIDPARLGGEGGDQPRRTESYLDWVRSSAPAEGTAEVLVPGDPEFRSRAAFGERMVIEPFTWGEIVKAARELGVGEDALPRGL